MPDDIAQAFGLAAIGSHNLGTYEGQPAETPDDPDAWRNDAACHPRNKPEGVTIAEWVDAWFPQRGDPVAHLRAICETCPALEPCQADALSRNDPGFQGGLSEVERKRRRRPKSRNRTAPQVAHYAALGWTDAQIARRVGLTVRGVQSARRSLGIVKDNHGRLVAGEHAA